MFVKAQKSWWWISLLLLQVCACSQKQTKGRPDVQPEVIAMPGQDDAPVAVPQDSLNLAPKPKPANPDSAEARRKTRSKGREVHAPMPEKKRTDDTERKELQKRKKQKDGNK